MWDTLDDLQGSGYSGLVSVRYKQANSPYCRYLVPVSAVPLCIDEFSRQGASPSLFTFNESAPDDDLLIQGEVFRQNILDIAEHPPYLTYSSAKLPMRKALQQDSHHAYGIKALTILKHYLDPNSYADLEELWERFPSSVVEFSTYSRQLGIYPHRNTIIWEVRDY
jgi:hypothetical protein